MYKVIKRIFDVVFSFLLICILLPVCLPIVFLLLITGEGEVFYKQERVGFKNQIFLIWKFATMLKNSPNMGTKDITLRNDPRVTRVGQFLRMSKLNELPQLINILKGDMSFVGPRPLMYQGYLAFPEEFKNRVYDCKPGLTGIGSVVFRDEEKIITDSSLPPAETYKTIIQPYKGALEIWYQSNISLYTDLAILLLTAIRIVLPEKNLVNVFFKDIPKFQLQENKYI